MGGGQDVDRPSPFRIEQYPRSVREALQVAIECGSTDGAHHKQWAIDQIVRALTAEMYESFVASYQSEGGEWDTGIAP